MSDEKTSAFQRLFIAIAVPEEIRERIARAQGRLRRCVPPGVIRWTRPEQFHVTIKFLGDVQVELFATVEQSVNTVCANVPTLQLSADGVGFFPGRHRPRVIWAGATDADNRLMELHRQLDAAMRPFAPAEKPGKFTGHITLGRFKPGRRMALNEFWERADDLCDEHFGQWSAAELEIVRCDLTAFGAVHTRLAACPLAT